MYIRLCVQTYTQKYLYIYLADDLLVVASRVYIHTYIFMYIYIYIYVYIFTYIYAYTHTHTYAYT